VLFLLVVLFAYIQLALLLATVDAGPFAIRMLIGGIFLFFTLLGNVLGKVRRNFWIGVRTPWTLANEYVWNQTHRVAAWLYTAIGILGLAAVLIGINLIAVFIVFMIGLLFPVPYSLYLYKRLQREGRLDSPAGSMS
jgi:uncharacterized membrane protein